MHAGWFVQIILLKSHTLFAMPMDKLMNCQGPLSIAQAQTQLVQRFTGVYYVAQCMDATLVGVHSGFYTSGST